MRKEGSSFYYAYFFIFSKKVSYKKKRGIFSKEKILFSHDTYKKSANILFFYRAIFFAVGTKQAIASHDTSLLAKKIGIPKRYARDTTRKGYGIQNFSLLLEQSKVSLQKKDITCEKKGVAFTTRIFLFFRKRFTYPFFLLLKQSKQDTRTILCLLSYPFFGKKKTAQGIRNSPSFQGIHVP